MGTKDESVKGRQPTGRYAAGRRQPAVSRRPNSRERGTSRRNVGIGAFTPDDVSIFDWVRPNVSMIADSNHGFKMTGVGKLVAKLLGGRSRVWPNWSPSPSRALPRGGL